MVKRNIKKKIEWCLNELSQWKENEILSPELLQIEITLRDILELKKNAERFDVFLEFVEKIMTEERDKRHDLEN